jgi:3'(2'), 5'-bisphosphate nucleotidase
MRKNLIKKLVNIAQESGQLVLSIYNQPSFQIATKKDESVLTEADIASHIFICDSLKKPYPDVPILSEESTKEYCIAIIYESNGSILAW